MTSVASPVSPLALASGPGKAHARDPMKPFAEAAKKFEALFMTEMLGHMYEGIETDGPFGGGRGEEIFRSLMIEQYGQKIASSGQTGLSKVLTREMLRVQELHDNPHAGAAPHVNA